MMELYNEVKDTDSTASIAVDTGNADSSDEGQGWVRSFHSNGRRRIINIETGFYVDNRDYLKVTEKVFFIQNLGNQSDKCLVARPNLGVYTEGKDSLKLKFNRGVFTRNPVSVERAMEIWRREYDLADIPFSEYYQKSCRGRHRESYVVSLY